MPVRCTSSWWRSWAWDRSINEKGAHTFNQILESFVESVPDAVGTETIRQPNGADSPLSCSRRTVRVRQTGIIQDLVVEMDSCHCAPPSNFIVPDVSMTAPPRELGPAP